MKGIYHQEMLAIQENEHEKKEWKRGDKREMIMNEWITNLGAPREIMVGKFAFKAILMHDPVALLSLGSPPPVENQGLLHANQGTSLGAINLPIFPSGFPVSSFSGPIGA